ncbi:hypothetical protein ACLK1Y_19705 [Escherichia coli]
MRSETVAFFGESMEWISPHMGTDVALMLGIARMGLSWIDWHDTDFFIALHHRFPDVCRLPAG